MITAHKQRREIADFTNLWFEFLGLAGNESSTDGSGDFNEEIIIRGVGRVKGDMGFLHPKLAAVRSCYYC